MSELVYPGRRISLAFLSLDDSAALRQAPARKREELDGHFARVLVGKRDYGFPLRSSAMENREALIRSSILARCRNYLLSQALQGEDWVLWLDARIARWPADLLDRLIQTKREIVSPNCVVLGTGRPYDLNSYKWQPQAKQRDRAPHMADGLLQPPTGWGRWYLNDLTLFDCVELDAVGSSALMVYGDLHREGLIFPSFPYKNAIESEGLSAMARDMGFRCFGLPQVLVYFPGGLQSEESST